MKLNKPKVLICARGIKIFVTKAKHNVFQKPHIEKFEPELSMYFFYDY